MHQGGLFEEQRQELLARFENGSAQPLKENQELKRTLKEKYHQALRTCLDEYSLSEKYVIEGASYESVTCLQSTLETITLDLEIECYLYNRETYQPNTDAAMRRCLLKVVLDLNVSQPIEKSEIKSVYEKRQGQFKLASDELEWVAERFVSRYFPENPVTPQPLDYMALVDKMNLTLVETDTLDVLGKIYIVDDPETQFKAGTILINKSHSRHQKQGVLANTIVHECLHWHLHRVAHKDLEVASHQIEADSHSYIEYQANSIANKVLLPKTSFIKKVEEVTEEQKQLYPEADELLIMKKVINQLKDFFGVSRQAVKIRLTHLGYELARGVYEWVDSAYVPAHSWKSGFLNAKQTFCISEKELEKLKQENPKLRQALEYGALVYVESHLCKNHPDYLRIKAQKGDFKMVLTDYARKHMDEACIVLTKNYAQTEIAIEMMTSLNRPALLEKVIIKNVNLDSLQLKDYEEVGQLLQKMPYQLGEALKYLMKEFDVKNEELAADIGVATETISKIRNDKMKPTIEMVVAICIGLSLPYRFSERLLQSAFHSLWMGNPLHLLYEEFLRIATSPNVTVESCNRLLKNNGRSPLTEGI
ncbi:XRE family transcriptional regulator [Streptococcus sp. sy004]|uniref:XRE family transcriptional regulator n=1 Tax=Streptococcus sp. sy004 TaxID=2600149 RepID=UPI0011B39BD5|nr:XRE family transcriptional regulator [Streptococcus sp. sy004]TWT11280.1 ImmA/IrrE family metallo-endopeptidase [Streptococcus sp. sy004]